MPYRHRGTSLHSEIFVLPSDWFGLDWLALSTDDVQYSDMVYCIMSSRNSTWM
jgi:hypothetical protein